MFDTNIFISAFVIPGGKAEDAYLHAVRGVFELFTSVAILTETAKKLRTKFGWSDDRVARLLRSISKTATVLKTTPHLHLLKDEPDDRILECALLAGADIIVTGDKPQSDRYNQAGCDLGRRSRALPTSELEVLIRRLRK